LLLVGQQAMAISSTGFYHQRFPRYGVGISYPDHYRFMGAGSSWFAQFGPSSQSLSDYVIFLSYQRVTGYSTLSEITDQYLINLENSMDSFRLVSPSRQTFLGGQTAFSVVYTFLSPTSGFTVAKFDILVKNYGGIYTLTFIGSPRSLVDNQASISHVINSFEFIPLGGSSGPS
jgi:hypothetical protein